MAFLSVPDGDAFQAIYYDTPQSLTPKLVLADDRGLAGAGFWALGYDRGQPAYGDLIGQFRAGQARHDGQRARFAPLRRPAVRTEACRASTPAIPRAVSAAATASRSSAET